MISPSSNLLLVLSSPSGAGKTTLCQKILAEDDGIRVSISATTRPMREGEVDGRDYWFLSQADFMAQKKEDVFLEDAAVFGFLYGTPKKRVQALVSQGFDVLFDVDWQGARSIADSWPGHVVRIFVLPPSLDALEMRLRQRGQDSAEVIARRLEEAESEMEHWSEYDYVVVNDDLEDAVDDLLSIIRAERLRAERFHAHA